MMIRKGIPRLNCLFSAKTSDHATAVIHERALVHCLIAEWYVYGRFDHQAPAIQNNAVPPLLYMSENNQYRRTGT